MRALRIATAATIVLGARVGAAQDSTAQRTTPARPTARSVRRSGPVIIDGVLDERAWQGAPPITAFTQQQPTEGAPATQRTEVRVLYDDGALYIGARMYDTQGARGVRRQLVRRDAQVSSDLLTIDLDPFRDRLHHAQFSINPSGVRGDALDGDASWDPVWEGAARIDSLGWTAEMRIPLSQLRFPRDSVQTWGMEITRLVQRLNEYDLWSFYPRNAVGGPAFYGALTGIAPQGRPSRLELLPYGVVGTSRLTPQPGNPLFDAHKGTVRVGADVKYLAASNLTLSATINPDFGQVEVDPAVVNLSAYETYYSEKRPFFVEGSNLFTYGQPACDINCGLGLYLFYSRRVGRPPQGSALAYAAGPYTDVPENTTILGAAKLTGRTASGDAIGVLDAVTRGASAPVITSDGARITQPVQPPENDFVGRVSREMRGGNLSVGGMLTSAYRDINDPGLASLLDRHAETGGVDATAYWGEHTYMAYGAIAASDVEGDSGAIQRIQRSSAHYFQRPDLRSAHYDPSATSLRGYGSIVRVTKQGGNWLWDLNGTDVSPGFETNDLGFQQQAGWRWVNASLGRQYTQPTRAYRTLTLFGNVEQQWDYDGDVTGHDASAMAQIEFPNYWKAMLFVTRAPGAYSDRLTRGGPLVRQAGARMAQLSLGSDPRQSVSLTSHPRITRGDDGSFDGTVDLGLTWRPASNVSLSVDPVLESSRATDQYVRAVSDPTATAFYGTRYVFAHLDQRIFSMTTRAAVTFTPALSLQLFAQPLIASGHYTQFEEFAAPRQLHKLVYGQDVGTIQPSGTGSALTYTVDPDGPGAAAPFTIANPDFNIRSLRGTAVLRWEYRPGSTAYLVWTQTRDANAAFGNFDFGRDRAALFAAHPDNIFLLKISYWLGL